MPWQHKSFHEKSTSPGYPENSQGNPRELYGHGTTVSFQHLHSLECKIIMQSHRRLSPPDTFTKRRTKE